ncbi:hypothetical protein EXIGLDRAFT_263346 [Exidia glandulosa HHB12029]|uniref:Uncharacterized protein n=1 Tax=Exidia glandulosa HHB12029 TaxID=1314781 RepID=A0A165DRT5_EXIGL|nr:hypothetical protein EXIGLDRAFT_263346 [Exidia glandulosa HHB12029]
MWALRSLASSEFSIITATGAWLGSGSFVALVPRLRDFLTRQLHPFQSRHACSWQDPAFANRTTFVLHSHSRSHSCCMLWSITRASFRSYMPSFQPSTRCGGRCAICILTAQYQCSAFAIRCTRCCSYSTYHRQCTPPHVRRLRTYKALTRIILDCGGRRASLSYPVSATGRHRHGVQATTSCQTNRVLVCASRFDIAFCGCRNGPTRHTYSSLIIRLEASGSAQTVDDVAKAWGFSYVRIART